VNKTLIFATSSDRFFFKLPETVRESLTRKLYLYALTGEGDVKRMSGSDALRLRDGDYRVIFRDTPDGLLILAAGIGVTFTAEERRP
jgi:mRNA interferase RelE/StbE